MGLNTGYNPFCPPGSQVTTRLLSEEAVIAAVSASIDWFDSNRGGPVPTAEEMSSLLEGFRRAGRVVSPPPAAHPPSPERVVRAPSPQEEESRASTLTSRALNFLRSPLPTLRRLRRRPIARLGETARPDQPRRALDPAASRASQEADSELEGRLALDQSSREAEASRAAQRARTREEAGQVEVTARRTPADPTPTSSNTFAHPEYSDSDSDTDDGEQTGLTLYGARPLWIPTGYKALAAGGQCDPGSEFDLPGWVGIKRPEDADRLAEAWNERVLGADHQVAEDLRGLPTVRLGVPLLAQDWLTQEAMADRFACQQEFEKLLSPSDLAETPEGMAEIRRKAGQAEELVRRRKEAAKVEEEEALARARSKEARLARAKVDRSTGSSAPSQNRRPLESPASRPNPPTPLGVRTPSRLRAPRRMRAALRAAVNLSPIPEEAPQVVEGLNEREQIAFAMAHIAEDDLRPLGFPRGR